MKVSKQQAAENRERILTEAARLFREQGLSGVGVDALTEAAGLTHGSLYSQFGSKDRLMAEAVTHAFVSTAANAGGIKSMTNAVATYLSARHRETPGFGCSMAALGGDMPRQSRAVRHAFTQGVKGTVARLGALLSMRHKRVRDNDALFMLATMVGAMVLARAVDDPKFSDRILSVTRLRLSKSV
jgi:TetR/AcrR family transcriptional regulator, transcriptional repressor for nem operon